MRKEIKFPIFLGSVCLIASAALAGVNALTAPVIAQREEEARKSGYLEALGLTSGAGYTMSELQVAEGDLATSGITGYVYFVEDTSNTIFGAVYNGEVSGWESGIKFQIGIADGLFTGYINISNNETPTIGGQFITSLDAMLTGVDAGDSLAINDAINTYITANFAGVTANFAGVTRGGITSALLAAGVHFDTLEVPA
jgi:Na+-translocating ferredoxin:NAD+ oxidoreductase RnfG subunit